MSSSKRASNVPHYGLHASPTKKVARWIQLPSCKSAPASSVAHPSTNVLTNLPPLHLGTPSRRRPVPTFSFQTSPSSSSSRSTADNSPAPSAAIEDLASSAPAQSTGSPTPSTKPLVQTSPNDPDIKDDRSITLRDLIDMPRDDFLAFAKSRGIEWIDRGPVLLWVGETGYPDVESEEQAFANVASSDSEEG